MRAWCRALVKPASSCKRGITFDSRLEHLDFRLHKQFTINCITLISLGIWDLRIENNIQTWFSSQYLNIVRRTWIGTTLKLLLKLCCRDDVIYTLYWLLTVYCTAILIDRNASLARTSVRLFVPYGTLTRKRKRTDKSKVARTFGIGVSNI